MDKSPLLVNDNSDVVSDQPKYFWVDFIRIVAIFLVILGHVSAVPMLHLPVEHPSWTTANIYNVIARACVPMIFMISGALLLTKQESIRSFFRKRLQKVFLPFLVWSILYLLAAHVIPFDNPISAIKFTVRDLLTRPAEYHLWFMYELLWLYLFTPVLRVFTKNANREHLWYFMAIWFVFGPLQAELEMRSGLQFLPDLGYLTGHVGYFILGYMLSEWSFTTRHTMIAAVMYVIAAAITAQFTFTSSLAIGRLDTYYQSLTNWNIAALSISGFIVLKSLGDRIGERGATWFKNGIRALAPATFGIYLIHIFVMRYLNRPVVPWTGGLLKLPAKYSLSSLAEPAVFFIPALTLAIFLVSWMVIALLRKIPYLRAIT